MHIGVLHSLHDQHSRLNITMSTWKQDYNTVKDEFHIFHER
jgi:hypothetical protein